MDTKRVLSARRFPAALLMTAASLVLLVPSAFAADAPPPAADAPASAAGTQREAPQAGPDAIRFKGGLPEVLPIPGDPRPYAESAYAAHIDRALAFLVYKDRGPNRLFRLVLLDHLQRRFQLHERYSLRATNAPHLQDPSSGDLANFKRLTDPQFVVEQSVIEKAEPMERLALRAMYCDTYPLEPTFLDEMNTEVNKGMSPFLPSVALAYLWLRDNACLTTEPKFMLVRDGLAVKFRNHLQKDGASAYMAAQSLALLYACDHREMVDLTWLVKIAEAQNEDGGWPALYIPDQKGASDGMATVHLLWALLEDALPNAPRIPMLPPKAAAAAK